MTKDATFNTARVESNLRAIASLFSKSPDPKLLRQYSGWGGLRDAVYTPKIYWQMKRYLSDDEINSIKQTLKNAYFTPVILVNFLYQMLEAIGSRPTRILEPSAGNGVFLEHMPAPIRKNAKVTAIEIESVSAALLEALYPEISIVKSGLEHFEDSEGFDLIIGNPPFGQCTLSDPNHPDLSTYNIHSYFIGKCMRLLKPGGTLAMIISRYFLDAPQKHVRNLIAKEGGSLVAAYRLPDDLFEDAKVTVDAIFLKKAAGDTAWQHSRKISEGEKSAFLNEYFLEHPENILGKLNFLELYGRGEITCRAEASDLASLLKAKIASYPSPEQLIDPKALRTELAQLQAKLASLGETCQRLSWIRTELDAFEYAIADLNRQTASIMPCMV